MSGTWTSTTQAQWQVVVTTWQNANGNFRDVTDFATQVVDAWNQAGFRNDWNNDDFQTVFHGFQSMRN